jgi:hypothetical protein
MNTWWADDDTLVRADSQLNVATLFDGRGGEAAWVAFPRSMRMD